MIYKYILINISIILSFFFAISFQSTTPTTDVFARTCHSYLLINPCNFRQFIWNAWPILEPTKILQWNKHLDAIVDHLEAVRDGRIEELMINVPPRTMKSLIVSVMWPCYLWTQEPSLRFILSSSTSDLVTSLSLKRRTLLQSTWYKERWGNVFKLASDQNVKQKVHNDKQGVMHGIALLNATATGFGCDWLIIDDPHDVKHAESKAKIEQAKIGYAGMWSRNDNPKKPKTVLVAQRIGADDLCGSLLKEKDCNWVLLCIPMIFETAFAQPPTSIGWKDWRTKEGELLWPKRFTHKYIEKAKIKLNVFGFAAQHQQRPKLIDGGLFDTKKFKRIDMVNFLLLRKNIVRFHRHWDLASTDEKFSKDPDYTAGLLMAIDKNDHIYIIDYNKFRLSPGDSENEIRRIAVDDRKRWGNVSYSVETEKGSNGAYTSSHFIRRVLKGFTVKGQKLWGDKVARATPLAAQVDIGNVSVVESDNGEIVKGFTDFIEQYHDFPRSAHKDLVDSGSGGYHELVAPTSSINTTINELPTTENEYELPEW